MKPDPFTLRRLLKFAEGFRASHGQLPTLKDFAAAGFEEELVARAVREKQLEELYVTMTTGAVVKGYKPRSD